MTDSQWTWRAWAIVGAILVITIVMTLAALARDNGQYTNILPEVRDWANGLTNKLRQNCCSTADGLPAEIEYDTLGGHYRVFLEGEWMDVPEEAVLTGPNKAGFAMVWVWRDNGKLKIRCFIPGQEI